MKYTPENERSLIQQIKEGKSAIRWAVLAILFLVAAVLTNLYWFFCLLTEKPNVKVAFIAMIGFIVLAEYCRWAANDSKPESWK